MFAVVTYGRCLLDLIVTAPVVHEGSHMNKAFCCTSCSMTWHTEEDGALCCGVNEVLACSFCGLVHVTYREAAMCCKAQKVEEIAGVYSL